MIDWKSAVDFLSASASFIAIITVCTGWWLSVRKPIFIDRVSIRISGKNSFSISIFVMNRRSFPVTINTMHCFREKQYRVEKEIGQMPVMMSTLSLRERIFDGPVPMEVHAEGVQRFTFEVPRNIERPSVIYFSMDTTHGYLNCKCKRITYIAEAARVFGVDFIHVGRNRWQSAWFYVLAWAYWALLKSKMVSEKYARKILPKNNF